MSVDSMSFQSLRVALDEKLSASALIVVSAARHEDDAIQLARGLAQAFAANRKSVALISVPGGSGLPIRSVWEDGTRSGGTFYHAPLTTENVDAFVRETKSKRQIAIVVAPSIRENGAPLELCRMADGVLLGVRLGRRITAEDQATAIQLERVSAKMLGLVAMREESSAPAQSLKRLEELWTRATGFASSLLACSARRSLNRIVESLRVIGTHGHNTADVPQPAVPYRPVDTPALPELRLRHLHVGNLAERYGASRYTKRKRPGNARRIDARYQRQERSGHYHGHSKKYYAFGKGIAREA
jgi:hypothetical protein